MCNSKPAAFEMGKTYRCRDGKLVTLDTTSGTAQLSYAPGRFVSQPLVGRRNHVRCSWSIDGTFGPPSSVNDQDLMPGAIEDCKHDPDTTYCSHCGLGRTPEKAKPEIEVITTNPIRKADAELIQAVVAGKTIRSTSPGGARVLELTGESALRQILECPGWGHRIKPIPVVQYLPVTKDGTVYGASPNKGTAKARMERTDGIRIVRLELDPDTLEVISAKTEAP